MNERTKDRQEEKNHAQLLQLKQPRLDIVVFRIGSLENNYQYNYFVTRAKALFSFQDDNTGCSMYTFDD